MERLGMNVQATIRDIWMLKSIVATLLALAALAERAGARSYPVRVLALCFLRPAEAIACEFVAEVAPAQRLAGNALLSNGSDDPVHLAARFRTLAAALVVFLRILCRFDCWNARPDGLVHRIAPCPGRHPVTLGVPAPEPHDTS